MLLLEDTLNLETSDLSFEDPAPQLLSLQAPEALDTFSLVLTFLVLDNGSECPEPNGLEYSESMSPLSSCKSLFASEGHKLSLFT